MTTPRVFISIYTHQCKQYCDEAFYGALSRLTYENAEVHIVDNSPGETYTQCLAGLFPCGSVSHIEVSRAEPKLQFQNNVLESLMFLRDMFLAGDCDYFFIIESDVLVLPDCVESLLSVTDQADIVGGIYYRGWHEDSWFEPQHCEVIPVSQALSGCTLYSRAVIEACHFRYEAGMPGAFPDYWISKDALDNGFKVADYTKVKCEHLHDENGTRGMHLIT